MRRAWKNLKRAVRSIPWWHRWGMDRADRRLARGLDPTVTGLRWQPGPRCPLRTVEGNRAVVGSRLFVTGGYEGELARVSRRLVMLEMAADRWTDLGEIPPGMPETHNALVSDGRRHLFSLTGQLGPHCCPAVPSCFAYDTETRRWSPLPPLPEPRYMPMADHHQGRLYVAGGTLPDRSSPAFEVWSLGVHDGRAVEPGWRFEGLLPESRTHTPCLILEGKLHVFGGQTGDVPALPGSAEFLCNFQTPNDVFFDEVFTLDLATWTRTTRAPMPLKISHTEYSTVRVGGHVIIAAGTLARTVVSDAILAYSLERDTWKIIGRLPTPMKKTVLAHHDGWLRVVAGQRARSAQDLRPGPVVDSVWKARLADVEAELP